MRRIILPVIFFTLFLNANTLQEKNEKCQNSNFKECFALGEFYSQENKDKNYVAAKDFFIKACAGGIDKACTKLSKLYMNNVNRDYQKAFMYANMSCEKGDFEACVVLGDIYFYGNKVDKDMSKAFEYYENSCTNNYANACVKLAGMYEYGDGIPKNTSKAKELYSKACEHKHKDACIILESLRDF